MKKILFCLLAAVLVLSASCDQEIKPVEYKVSFDANGGNGTLPDSLTVVEGGDGSAFRLQFKSGREFSDCMLKKIIVEGKVSPLKDTFYHCPIEEIVFGNAELVWPDEVLAKALDEKLLKEPNKVKILVGV